MDRHRRTRRTTALVALSAAFAISAIAPSLASGQNVVNDLLKGLGLGGQSASPAAGVPGIGSGYQPPAHGSNPHGQGTVGTLDFHPSDTLPLSGDPAGGDGEDDEEVVLGRSRGEQNPDGTYHGHITILSLFGNELGVDTDPGESESGPLDPIQQNVLNAICAGSGGQFCLAVLAADSETTSSGSTNSFNAVNLNFAGSSVSLMGSNGNIQSDGTCQTAHGDSHVARFQLGEDASGVAGESSTDSQACNNGTSSQTNDSRFLELFGTFVPFPCESGEPDSSFGPFGFIAFACNADDKNGVGEDTTQMDEPYGVREALTVFLGRFFEDNVAFSLIDGDGGTAFLKGTAAASESHAVAPPAPPTTTTPAGVGAGGQAGQQGGGPEGQAGGPNGPVAETAAPGTGDLAFTGTDVLILGLIGAGLVMAGLTATRLAVRNRRATA